MGNYGGMCLHGSAPTSTEGRALPIESPAAFPSSPWVSRQVPSELLPRPTVAELTEAAELTAPGNRAPGPHRQESFPGHHGASRSWRLTSLFITITDLNTNNIPVPATTEASEGALPPPTRAAGITQVLVLIHLVIHESQSVHSPKSAFPLQEKNLANEILLNERKKFVSQRPDPIKDSRSMPDLHIITMAMNTQAFLFYPHGVQGYLNSPTLSYFLLFAIHFSFTF